MSDRVLKFVDLFAGIGGIRLGLESALNALGVRHSCVFSCEIDKKARETYEMNFGETPFPDVRQVDNLPEHDILLAGFPCQAFSYAGKRLGFGDTRGTLFFEIERLLTNAEHKPQYLLLENVRGFFTHDGGRTFKTVINRLESLGYFTEALLLNSSDHGVPQNRVRVYIVAKLNSKPQTSIVSSLGAADSHKYKKNAFQRGLFDHSKSPLTVKDILEPSVHSKYHCSEKFISMLKDALPDNNLDKLHGVRLIDYRGGNSLHSWDLGLKGKCTDEERSFMNALIENRRKKCFGTEKDGKKLTRDQIVTFWDKPALEKTIQSLIAKGYLSESNGGLNPVAGNMSFEVFKFLDPESISITVVSSDANRLGVVQNGIPRRITPRECARLQGFPDFFKLHPNDGRAYHQLGNSVSVPVITKILTDVLSKDLHTSLESQKPTLRTKAVA